MVGRVIVWLGELILAIGGVFGGKATVIITLSEPIAPCGSLAVKAKVYVPSTKLVKTLVVGLVGSDIV